MKKGNDWRGKYLKSLGAVSSSHHVTNTNSNSILSAQQHIDSTSLSLLSSSFSISTSAATVGTSTSQNNNEDNITIPSISVLSSVAASLPILKNNIINQDSLISSTSTIHSINIHESSSSSSLGLAISLPYDTSGSTTSDAHTPISPFPLLSEENNMYSTLSENNISNIRPNISRNVTNERGGRGGRRGEEREGIKRKSVGNIDESDIFGYGLELSSSSGGGGGSNRGIVSHSNSNSNRGGGSNGLISGIQHRVSIPSTSDFGEGDSGSQGSQRESDRLSDTTGSSIPHESGGLWSGLPGAQRVVNTSDTVNAVHWRSQLELQKQRSVMSELEAIDKSLDNSLPEAPAPINALAAAASLQKKKKDKGKEKGMRKQESGIEEVEEINKSISISKLSFNDDNTIKDMITLPKPIPLMGLGGYNTSNTTSTSLKSNSSSGGDRGGGGGGSQLVEVDEEEEEEEEEDGEI
jgi:hypothetical protein